MGQHNQRYITVGLKIAYYRKLNELTQEQLAELIHRSPSYLSQVESPSKAQPISLEMLFSIADALNLPPAKLLDNHTALEVEV